MSRLEHPILLLGVVGKNPNLMEALESGIPGDCQKVRLEENQCVSAEYFSIRHLKINRH